MADLPYRIVIGLEVHVQLLTQTKLFCGCSTRFGQPPNSATCPVCLGLPGALPVMNRRAFDLAVKAALALNCRIASFTKWDRKNYYYPDLPKNYQISQYDLPFSSDGHLDIQTPEGTKRIGIIRAHLEEDAGKLLHEEGGSGKDSLVDLNRTGTPLLEIVSQPELSAPEEAKAYLEELRLLLKALEISDCEMQEGSLRCDANVNIHVPHADGVAATPIVEVKNLNSFRAVERAIKFEANRQYGQFQSDGKKLGDRGVSKATAGWDDVRGVTVVQRRKEEASDYRYFPDPDLVPIEVDSAWIAEVRALLGELPAAQRTRLQSQYALSAYDTEVITRQGRPFVAYFEELARGCGDAAEAKNWLTNEILQTLNDRKSDVRAFPQPADAIAELIREAKATGLNKQRARDVYAHMVSEGGTAKEVIKKLGFTPVTDEGQLRDIVRRAMAANAKAVTDFKNGKVKAADAIKGAVMRETKGMARTEMVQQILLEELQRA
ncbi:MAG: Asp-tRNA(Asn)/Glu-tRNA(Gln) amidotransferase subunit GatB [Gemmataceae bacterium]|nr:Asp-tRNA(Asn)/Glu-tRNA(Gln) amidotransferase subunit GatB [Gemmataceae bacterium]